MISGLRDAVQASSPLSEVSHAPISALADLCEVKLPSGTLRPICSLVSEYTYGCVNAWKMVETIVVPSRIHVHKHIRVHVHKHIQCTCTQTYTCTYTQTYTCTCTQTYTCTCTHTYTCTQIYT